MLTLDELKALLAINKANLDDEVSKQPSLFFDVAEAVVAAVSERDTLKEQLASVDAELDGVTRTFLAKREEKVTEAMVKNAIQKDKRHEKAFDAYMKIKTEADLLLAMKEAFAQRSYMLRDLCQLYVSSYFEQASVQGTSVTDRAVYDEKRRRIGEARRERPK